MKENSNSLESTPKYKSTTTSKLKNLIQQTKLKAEHITKVSNVQKHVLFLK